MIYHHYKRKTDLSNFKLLLVVFTICNVIKAGKIYNVRFFSGVVAIVLVIYLMEMISEF